MYNINKWCNLNIKKSEIINYNKKLTIPKIFSNIELEILRNNDKSFLLKNHKNLYERYRKYNPDNIIFTNKKWTEELVINEINKLEGNLKGLYINNPPLYQVIQKRFKHLIKK